MKPKQNYWLGGGATLNSLECSVHGPTYGGCVVSCCVYAVGWFGAVRVQYEKLDGLLAEARDKKTKQNRGLKRMHIRSWKE